jgi:hypothetical protein
MKHDYLDIARRLSDHDLMARVTSLAGRERAATAELIAHLAEIDARRLHLGAGFASMFTYCRDALSLSEDEAYRRIEAARVARRFPMALDLLVEGAINLTTMRLLAPHLRADNYAEVLETARGLKKAQVEELVARLAPRPDVPTSVRRLPAPRPVAATPSPSSSSSSPSSSPSSPPPSSSLPAASPVAGATQDASPTSTTALRTPEAARAAVSALAPDRYKLQLTIGGDTLERLRLAKDLLRHALPSGDDATVLDRALRALLEELMKKKFAATDRPRAGDRETKGARYIPADVKRAVFVRDFGRCAFMGPSGRRCGERAFVEFHHVQPWAEDGRATTTNIELRCQRHNGHEWQQWCADRSQAEDGAGRLAARAGASGRGAGRPMV